MTNAIKNVFAYLVDAVTRRWRPDAIHKFFSAIMGGSRFVSRSMPTHICLMRGIAS